LQQSALAAIVNAPRSVLVRTGQTASLSVTVSGAPAPTLQWQTRAANSTDAWSDVTTGAGPTTANYTTAATTLADNGIQYRVVATNALGSTASTAVTVSVSDLDVAPSISTQPANLSVTSGSDAAFAVDARGTEALSYQWRFNGTAIVGANSPVLRLTNVTSASAGAYSVTVSNSAGDEDSDVAVLTVSAGIPTAVAPTIVTQPSAVTVNVGNTATFAVGINGSGPFSFQWNRNGAAIPGATTAVLALNSVETSDAANYSVLVSNAANPAGVLSDAAALTVTATGAVVAPFITTQPSTLIVAPGGSGILAVAATGSGPLSYQWSRGGASLAGATAAVLVLTNVSATDIGSYTATVSNSRDTITSEPADVILLGAPVVTQQPAAATMQEGETAKFSVVASGSALRYQWLLNGQSIGGADQASYTTTSLMAANTGAVYSVIVYNGAGVALSQSAVLTVLAFTPPSVAQHPESVTVEIGSPAKLCAAFGGTPPFTVQMTRWSGTAWLPVLAARLLNDNSEACMTTPVLQFSDTGAQFRFEAASGPGLAFTTNTNSATITVRAPTITVTTLASRATSGATANNRSADPTLSTDGNLVAFTSDGTNLVPGFTGAGHGYVHNLITGLTTAVDQMPNGGEPNGRISQMKLAAGGRYVVFTSSARGIVANDTNNAQDVFLRDLQTGTTKQVTVLPDGSELPDGSGGNADTGLDISADGRYVIFSSTHDYTNAGAPFRGNTMALLLRDTLTDQTRVLVSNPTYNIGYAAIASGGEYVAYALGIPAPSPATVSVLDLETNISGTIFTLDQTGRDEYLHQGLSISGNGRYVAFALRSPALLGTTWPQVVVIDRNDPNTLMVASTGSTGSGIGLGDGLSNYPKLSDDGRYVVFFSMASNISGNVGNSLAFAFMLRDLQAQTTAVASRRADGAPVRTATSNWNSHVISGDGKVVAFAAYQTDMADGNVEHQVYVTPRS
ncbi:MAG: immunoglobulin domain-containing protein, partial [Povalibacter sp.]